MPKLSVIVPVYNAEDYLHRCIDSILAQTFTDFELLLINDGSKDNSGKICDEYAAKDNRIRVFHKDNGGVSSARNVGLDNVRGEYVTFVDSDDWIEPEMYKAMLYELGVKVADVCFCDIRISSSLRTYVEHYGICGNKDEDISNYIYREWHSSCNIVAKNEIFEKNRLRYPEGISFCEDFHLTLRLLCFAERIINVDEAFYIYNRDNESSATHNFSSKKHLDRYWCDVDIISFLKVSGKLHVYEKAMSERVLSYTQLWVQDKSKWNDFLLFFPESHSYILSCRYVVRWRKLLMWCICKRLWILADIILWSRGLVTRIKD